MRSHTRECWEQVNQSLWESGGGVSCLQLPPRVLLKVELRSHKTGYWAQAVPEDAVWYALWSEKAWRCEYFCPDFQDEPWDSSQRNKEPSQMCSIRRMASRAPQSRLQTPRLDVKVNSLVTVASPPNSLEKLALHVRTVFHWLQLTQYPSCL